MELALTTTTERKTKGFFWSDSANQFVARIGYHFGKSGDRVRTPQYLGRFERAAAALVKEKHAEWERVKEIWPQIVRRLADCVWILGNTGPENQRITIDLSLPVWTTDKTLAKLIADNERHAIWRDGFLALQYGKESPKQLEAVPAVVSARQTHGADFEQFLNTYAQKREQTATAVVRRTEQMPWIIDRILSERGQVAIGRNDPAALALTATPTTIRQLKDLFLADEKGDIDLGSNKGIKQSTWKQKMRTLNYALGISLATKQRARITDRKPIDLDLLLSDLRASHLKEFVRYWCGMDMEDRSQANYCRAFKEMLDWAADQEELHFNMPKGVDDLFSFRKSKSKIKPHTPEMIKKLLTSGTEWCKMFILMGLQLKKANRAQMKTMELRTNRRRYLRIEHFH